MKRLGHTTPHSPEWHEARRQGIGASEVQAWTRDP